MKITKIAIVLLLGIMLVSGFACGGAATPTYQLFTSVDGQGSVSPSSGSFSEGDTVTLTATPASCWQFDHWSGDASGSQQSVTITMNSDKTVTAHFTKIQYPLSISVSPSGSGSISPSGGNFDCGTQITLTATPASGWQFDHWSGDASGTSSTVTITIDSSKSFIAHFVHPPISVTLDGIGVYGCGDGWLRGNVGEQYLYVIVTDGETVQDLRVPAQEHFHLADNEDVSIGLTIFSTPEVGDYLRLFVTGWEDDGGSFETLIIDAIGMVALDALTGGATIGLEPLFSGVLGGLLGLFLGTEDDPLGTYERIWYPTDLWGVGTYRDVGTDDLRLWFTINEG